MEAKDTVMDDAELYVIICQHNMARIEPSRTEIALTQAQAEISFKAGISEVVEWIEEQGYYSNLSPCECLTNNKDWQEKLKEWGL